MEPGGPQAAGNLNLYATGAHLDFEAYREQAERILPHAIAVVGGYTLPVWRTMRYQLTHRPDGTPDDLGPEQQAALDAVDTMVIRLPGKATLELVAPDVPHTTQQQVDRALNTLAQRFPATRATMAGKADLQNLRYYTNLDTLVKNTGEHALGDIGDATYFPPNDPGPGYGPQLVHESARQAIERPL